MEADILHSKSSWKILESFLEQPWKQFYMRELISKAHIGPNTAVRIVKNMERSGIFISQKIGNIIAYRLSADNEVSKKLLMLHHEKRLQKITDEFKAYINRLRRKIEDKNNIISVVLFGSVSRGMAGELSDIDILVIHEGRFNKKEISNIFEKYSRYVQLIEFTKSGFDDMHKKGNELIINIIKSGIIIYDRDFYYKYLFKPIPKPTKGYIEGMLKRSEKDLEVLWEMYRKEKSTSIIITSLYPLANRVCTALVLLNHQIPESRKDMAKILDTLGERKLSQLYKTTRRIWDGEMLQLSKEQLEDILNLIENKLKECYMKLEVYNG